MGEKSHLSEGSLRVVCASMRCRPSTMKPVGERKNREETISLFMWEGCLPAVIGELTAGVGGGGTCCLDSATLVGVGVIDSARRVRVMDMTASVVNSRNSFVVRAASGPLTHLKMIDTW